MRWTHILLVATSLLIEVVNAQSPAAAGAASGVNVANVPDCAKICLSNSTQYATDCAQIDVKCLCNSPSYVSALSCCLATNCNAADQQTAIQFNIQECTAVNSSAPNFVGCSPFSLTTGAGGAKSTSATTANNDATTLPSADIVSVPVSYPNWDLGTATFGGNAILTGSCTVPIFAAVTDRSGNLIEYPQVGCALNRRDCCPFDPSRYLGLTKCPSDYTTIGGGCCPSGYSVHSSAIGAETPCVSKLSKAYIPASTISGATVITDTVFTRNYALVEKPSNTLSGGAIAGIVIGAVLAAAGTPAFLILLIRNMKKHKAEKSDEKQGDGITFPPVEPALDPTTHISEVPATAAPQSPHEMAGPPKGTPITTKGMPLPHRTPTNQSAYEVPAIIPLEMPGSTYMHEHHPAYGSTDGTPSTRRSPPQTPSAVSSPRSPVLSPSSPFRADSPSNTGNFVVTPLGSPRFREASM